jgi:hypothetical protein
MYVNAKGGTHFPPMANVPREPDAPAMRSVNCVPGRARDVHVSLAVRYDLLSAICDRPVPTVDAQSWQHGQAALVAEDNRWSTSSLTSVREPSPNVTNGVTASAVRWCG